MLESLTLPVVPWLVLAGLVGFLLGWWMRGRGMAGRMLTLERTYNNRVSAVEEDAKRMLERARADSADEVGRIEAERDRLRVRLERFDGSGRISTRPQQGRPHGGRGEPRSSAPRTGSAKTLPKADDLTRIKGIGPAFEDRLKELGYRTFRDIARWDAPDFEALGEEFGARVRLAEWSRRAAELHRAKYGDEA